MTFDLIDNRSLIGGVIKVVVKSGKIKAATENVR